jgi:hypothetical protein
MVVQLHPVSNLPEDGYFKIILTAKIKGPGGVVNKFRVNVRSERGLVVKIARSPTNRIAGS